MSDKVKPAKHRIVGSDTPESIARRKKIRESVESEKDELISEARRMMAPIVKERMKVLAILKSLRDERERQGLSLSDVAERTGMARESIHRLEVAKTPNPTLNTLQRYATSLGMVLQLSLSR